MRAVVLFAKVAIKVVNGLSHDIENEGVNGYVNGYVNGSVNGELNGELNPSQKATLKFIMEHEGCTASEISKKTSIPFSTIDKHIRVLLKVGVIERRGSKKTGGYYLVDRK